MWASHAKIILRISIITTLIVILVAIFGTDPASVHTYTLQSKRSEGTSSFVAPGATGLAPHRCNVISHPREQTNQQGKKEGEKEKKTKTSLC